MKFAAVGDVKISPFFLSARRRGGEAAAAQLWPSAAKNKGNNKRWLAPNALWLLPFSLLVPSHVHSIRINYW
jgi:hypothetical protein